MIALDANGADGGPQLVATGGRASGAPVLLFGPAATLSGDDVVDAPETITNREEPARAVRERPQASVVQAARAVAEGRCEGLVSAGSTGAMLAASLLILKRLPGVHRPAVAALVPVPGRPTLFLDGGANVEVRPEHLVQFAHMGAAFMSAVHDVPEPRVGLLSVGEEPTKGTPDVVEAHRRLAVAPGIRFVGNVEGHGLVSGQADVVVADGFTGNVAIKLMEGTAQTVLEAVRSAAHASLRARLGAMLLRPSLGDLRRSLDPDEHGGAILLGVRGVAVVAHGASSARGIANAVRLAQRAADEQMVERTLAALEAGGATRERSAPLGSVSS